VQAAKYKDKDLHFTVPQLSNLSSSLNIPAVQNPRDENDFRRHAPEYVHVRTKIPKNGVQENLNDQPNVTGIVASGGYEALHYIDFTGDGGG
jgi:hypothetical protein